MDKRAENSRLKFLDIAKGIGILLVVMGHSIPDASTFQAISNSSFALLHKIIYSFHMPLFFFLSGFLAKPLLDSAQKVKSLTKKFYRLIVPYFFVGLCYLPLKLIFSQFANKAYDFGEFWKIFIGINPYGELWFLYALFISSAVAIIFKNRVNNLGLALAAVLAVIDLQTVFLPIKFLWCNFFFMFGIYFRENFPDLIQTTTFKGAAGFLAAFALGNYYNLFFLPAVSGIILCLWISWKISSTDSKAVKILEVLGLFSMDIYILSDIIKIPFRVVFWNFLHMYAATFWICFICAVGGAFILSKYFIRRSKILSKLVLGLKI